MSRRSLALALAGLISASVLASISPEPASAVTLPAVRAAGSDVQAPSNGMYQEARSRNDRRSRWYYQRQYHGPRYRYPYNNYRYNYGGYWYDRPYWNLTIPFAFGAPYYYYDDYYYAPRRAYRNYSARHIDWCLARYRSYNVRTNTWVAYSGAVRQCVSPYGP